MPAPLTDEARLAKYVTKTETCWLWTGSTDGNGYGQTRINYRLVPAHRWAYEAFIGPIPPGMVLDHVAARGCTFKTCVNPAHLEPVTHPVNIARGSYTYEANGGLCMNGLHDMTVPGAKKGHQCRACVNASARRKRQERRVH